MITNCGTFFFPKSTEHALEYVEYLESSEYSKVWLGDSQLLFRELFTTLAVVAHESDSLEISTGITNPVTRHPSVLAGAITSIDDISDGRATLGIGAGSSTVKTIGKEPASVKELHDAVVTIQSLLAGETVAFGDTESALKRRTNNVDVHVAAEGPVTLRMAGEVGDGVIYGGGANPEIAEEFGLANIREGASNAGRSLDDIDLVALVPVCVADTKAEANEEIRHLMEPFAFHQYSHSVKDAPAELQDELKSVVEEHEFDEHAEPGATQADRLSDELLDYLADQFAVAGPPEYCQERIAKLEALGFDELFLSFPPATGEMASYAAAYENRVLDPLRREGRIADI